MLKIIKSMQELDSQQLIAVYNESILENAKQLFVEIPQAEEAFLSYLREDFFRQKGAFYGVFVEDNIYKSALRLEPYGDGLLLQGLETAPAYRNLGYAGALLRDVLEYLKSVGNAKVYSHIHKRNGQSLHLHQKCGFEIIADTAAYIDGTVTQNSYTLLINL